MTNQLYCWDFTIPYDNEEPEELLQYFRTICSKGAFQLEQGESSGYKHWQGRISFNKKQRIKQAIELLSKWNPPHVSPTTTENKNNFDYVTKERTKIGGPWFIHDNNDQNYIQLRFRGNIVWKSWQETVINMIMKTPDDRHINVIIDNEGNKGKSFLTMYLASFKMARNVPQMKDHRDILRLVMDMPESPCYIFDLPRATSKNDQHSIYSAIEQIKNGYAYDDRYNYKEKFFEPPHIFVFTNQEPDTSLLSNDRWVFWTISGLDLKALARNTNSNPYNPFSKVGGSMAQNNKIVTIPKISRGLCDSIVLLDK